MNFKLPKPVHNPFKFENGRTYESRDLAISELINSFNQLLAYLREREG